LYCSRDNRQWKFDETRAEHMRTGKPLLRIVVYKVYSGVFGSVLSLISVFRKICLTVCDMYEKVPLFP
jgi:hypothetical protein